MKITASEQKNNKTTSKEQYSLIVGYFHLWKMYLKIFSSLNCVTSFKHNPNLLETIFSR